MSLLLPRPCSARIFKGRPVRLQRGRCARCRLLAKASLSVSRVSHHQASFCVRFVVALRRRRRVVALLGLIGCSA